MNRIPILIHGALSEVINGGSGTIVSGSIEYELTWIEDEKALQLTNSATSEVQKIVLTGIGSGSGGSSELTDILNVTTTVGGATSGKTYPIGTDLEEILRDMLDPTVAPTFVAPSATISATGAKLLETGTTLNTTIAIAFNRGSISTGGYRAGEATGYSLNGGASQSGNTFPVTVSETNKSFSGSVSYGVGDQPKNSKGENHGDPLPAGSVNTSALNYEFVDPLYSNAANIAVVAKEALVSKSAKQKQFNFPPQTVSNPEIFEAPASWSITAVEVLNTLSGQWQDASSEFTVTDVTHGSTQYKKYTYNVGIGTGARSVRIKWS